MKTSSPSMPSNMRSAEVPHSTFSPYHRQLTLSCHLRKPQVSLISDQVILCFCFVISMSSILRFLLLANQLVAGYLHLRIMEECNKPFTTAVKLN